ncbi:uncharacterized protein LOC121728749 isoform X2 [Aricia agestis]|uniref:uncharacterized protein LOC121728749 isoform X2 n=1 Tax=Aricia agestis TaxID=91739 RepID=UPI001C207BF7|nr:uncharacterized protein LOC121728749 isoform X2 [Aricia agestis]
MKKRSARVSEAQWNIILNFLDRNPSLAKSRSYNNSAKGRAQATQLWQEVADALNAEVSGTYKTPKDWSIYVSNYKSKLKKIVSGINADVSGTGGGPPRGGSLTHIDTRFLAIMEQGFAKTEPDVSVKAFSEPYSPTPIPFHGTEEVIIFPEVEIVKPEPNSPASVEQGEREADDVFSKDRKEPEPSLPRRTRQQRYRKRPSTPLVEARRILQKVELQRSAAELRNAEALNLIGQNIGRLADVLERFLARDMS